MPAVIDLDRILVYVLAAVLIAVAIAVAIAKHSNSLRARQIKGNVQVGDVYGETKQVFTETGSPEGSTGTRKSRWPGDHVAWVIAIIGVVIAAVQLAHDVLVK